MTKNLFRILLFLLLPLAGQAKDADSLRVLWVGNSYTYYNDMPAIVQQIAPQGNRGRRYTTGPGETYQMD